MAGLRLVLSHAPMLYPSEATHKPLEAILPALEKNTRAGFR